MFDADTVALISRAPALVGLDLDSLPQRLTDAYASIVTERIRLRQAAGVPVAIPAATLQTTREMRRLAYSLEALVSALPTREDRAAAGFVAGTAHHVTLLAERLAVPEARPSALTGQGISPEVSGTLLFLDAEAVADAAGMSKNIVTQTDDPVERTLLRAVQHLADGRLTELLDLGAPPADRVLNTDRPADAVRSLYFMLLYGIRVMAARLLGNDPDRVSGPFAADSRALFERVRDLSVDRIDDLVGLERSNAASLFPGPAHMASLLLAVERDLPPTAVASLPPPTGADQQQWFEAMRRIANRRPYLWPNHRQAIEAGYLEPGVSSVISFPTGAGKSTLAELKIAAALLRGDQVVFLAPTLALVDQTARALGQAFPDAAVQKEREEGDLIALDQDDRPAVAVMTPERCLALLSFDREAFNGVGLLVFDECHLLHPRDSANSRRAVDSMLCLLNFTLVAPQADVLLLSAMMANADELAAWMAQLTSRRTLSLDLTWKPTRQVRGCVVYPADRITALRDRLRVARAASVARHAPAAVKRELTVQPFGFFCLRQTWSERREDYALLPLLDQPVTVAAGTATDARWYLTPNGNRVAATLAAASAAQGLKSLVFTQTIPLATAAVNEISEELGGVDIGLTAQEVGWYDEAREEAGGEQYLYVETVGVQRVSSSATVHHGLLLPSERHLHESLFRRADGVRVLVATSTLAQGMNLPAEVVIIAGDSRFDPDANRLERLEAHELLNAAGRAGRAGDSAQGFVLVVPSKVVDFDNATSRIASHWAQLQSIFSQSDQCIAIEDPLVSLLDQIHNAAVPLSASAEYLLRRLPADRLDGDDDEARPVRELLGRSLGAFLARTRNDEAWIQSRVDAVLVHRRADPANDETIAWVEQIAAGGGVPVQVVRDIRNWLYERPVADDASVVDWREAVFDWLDERPAVVPMLLRREGLEGLFGARYRSLEQDADRGQLVLPLLRVLCREWMAGRTLAAIERAFGTEERRLGKCKAAREFVARVVPELAFVFGLVSQVARGLRAEGRYQGERHNAVSVEALAGCVREGFDRPEKLALRIAKGRRLSRVMVHHEYINVEAQIEYGAEAEGFRALLERVKRAVRERDEWRDGDA